MNKTFEILTKMFVIVIKLFEVWNLNILFKISIFWSNFWSFGWNITNIWFKFLEDFGQISQIVWSISQICWSYSQRFWSKFVQIFEKILAKIPKTLCEIKIFEITLSQSRFSPQVKAYYRVVTFWTFWRKRTNISQKHTY